LLLFELVSSVSTMLTYNRDGSAGQDHTVDDTDQAKARLYKISEGICSSQVLTTKLETRISERADS